MSENDGTYKALLLSYNKLKEENELLKAEVVELRKLLGMSDLFKGECPKSSDETSAINKYSSSAEKVDLFRSLFKGRQDVFARRWQSASTGKSGYQPVCENEWAEGLCDKRKFKCSNCPNRNLKPLTDEDIYRHLEGKDPLARDVIGIYPMLQDEACYFLCADFDEKSYKEDVTAFREVCTELAVPVCVERSRSGNGGHARIFFESPVPAVTARKLGSGILTKAMEKRGELSFKSYDRLFPKGEFIPVAFNGELREEQKPAADALLEQNTGVLSATTAFGKTVIASYLISQRKTNTLILVHTQALMTQWKKSLGSFLKFDITPPEEKKGRGRKKVWSPIGVLGAGKDTMHGIVDVAVMQSLVSGDEVKEIVRNYGTIIVDECHHVSAVNFEMILKYANAKYVYGLTATPTRQDGHHPIIFMQCGAIRYRVDAKEQAEKRSFEHYLVPRFTNTRYPSEGKTSITDVYKKLSENEIRNNMIVSDVVEALKEGRNPIVLTERREHVALLAERLACNCKNVIQLVGTASAKERRETMERLEAIPGDESVVIVATGKYVGEGFDYPRLDTLFLALPIAWKGKVAQYAGRLHRNFEGKTEVQVYDYVDIHIPVLERMYQKRVKSYSSIGYKTKLLSNVNAAPDL